MTDSDVGLDVMFEGTQRGTPRRRALFGPGCSESVSPVSGVAEAQTGWPTEDEFRGGGGGQAPTDETAVCCARLDDFD